MIGAALSIIFFFAALILYVKSINELFESKNQEIKRLKDQKKELESIIKKSYFNE